jgi:hypothetical protein
MQFVKFLFTFLVWSWAIPVRFSAVTQEKSDELDNFQTDRPQNLNRPDRWGGRLRRKRFTFTQGLAVGDAGSLAELIRLPPGRVTLYLNDARVSNSALGASRTMDLGWLAYRNTSDVAVAADPNGLVDGVDVSGAVVTTPTGLIGDEEAVEFDSQEGVTITAQINDGTIPIAATLKGYFTYQHD